MAIKVKPIENITRAMFIGFVIAVLIFFFTNVKINWTDPLHDGAFRFIGYFLIMATVIVLSIERPSVSKFFKALYEALQDGKLTPEEQVGLIRLAFTEFLGFWADLTQGLAGKAKLEEAKEAAENPPVPPAEK